jgi:hypothetical protein
VSEADEQRLHAPERDPVDAGGASLCRHRELALEPRQELPDHEAIEGLDDVAVREQVVRVGAGDHEPPVRAGAQALVQGAQPLGRDEAVEVPGGQAASAQRGVGAQKVVVAHPAQRAAPHPAARLALAVQRDEQRPAHAVRSFAGEHDDRALLADRGRAPLERPGLGGRPRAAVGPRLGRASDPPEDRRDRDRKGAPHGEAV